jgi:hypothetical protein
MGRRPGDGRAAARRAVVKVLDLAAVRLQRANQV